MAGIVLGYGVRGIARLDRLPVASTATFKQGHFLTVNSSNELVIAVAAGSRMAATSGNENLLVGRAIEDSHDENGVRKTSASFIVAEPGTDFEVPLHHATPGSAVATPATGQLNAAGFELISVNTAGGVHCLSLDNTTNKKWQIMGYNPEDLPTWPNASTAGTTQYPRAWVTTLQAASLLGAK